jgi:acetyltransferase-like isoleucine patch superfamily enzyme
MKLLGVSLGSKIQLAGSPLIFKSQGSKIEIGNRVQLISNSLSTALGVHNPVIIRTLFEGSSIHIGNDCGLSGTVICAANSISIGERCLIGSGVLIIDTDFHDPYSIPRRYLNIPKGSSEDTICIGDDVFIGARSIILKGVNVGTGSVVGAGSVVVNDVPAYSVVAGNPARIINKLTLNGS